jgi:lipoate-protein ligase A
MLILNLDSYDPCFNLAVDEFLLKNRKENFLVLSVNDPSLVVGKHQAAHRETDTKFVTLHKIPVIRRISGGGTVFHDRGNINFSFILQSEPGKQVDFRRYTLPVINFLASCGIDAKFEGKNDLKVGGFKISGNAEHVYHERVLHHGTLLFETDLHNLRNALRKDVTKYLTRAVESNPSLVMNLKEKLTSVPDAGELKIMMLEYFLKNLPDASNSFLSSAELAEIQLLSNMKYRTWEWNYAYGPEYKFVNYLQVSGKPHCFSILVKDGIIRNCSFSGSNRMVTLAKKLTGCRHMVDDMSQVLRKESILAVDLDVFDLF